MDNLGLNIAAILTRTKPLDRAILVSYEAPLFFLIEIEGSLSSTTELAQNIIDTVTRAYHESSTKIPEQNFEEAIKKCNDNLAKQVEEGQTEWLENISAIITLISENRIHITSVGNANCYLFRKDKEIDITKEQPKIAQPLKTFPHILSGKLEEKDKIVIGNPAFFEYFSLDFLKQTILKGPISETAEPLSRSLNKDHIRGARSIILETATKENLTEEPMVFYADETIKREVPNQTIEMLKEANKKSSSVLKRVYQKISGTASTLIKKVSQGIIKIGPFKRFENTKLTKTQKQIALFVTSIICLLVLAGIIGGAFWKGSKTINSTETKKAIISSEDKNRQAGILLTKGDKEGAEKLLKEALLPISAIQNKSANNLRDKINSQLDQIYNIVRVSPNEFFDFAKHFDNSNVSQIIVVNNIPYAVDEQNNKLYQGDKNPDSLPQVSGKFKTLGYQSIENIVLIYQDTEGLYEYKIDDEKLEKAPAVSDEKWKKATLLATYFTNVYLYEPDEGQIYKYEKTAAGYSKPLAYVNKDKTDLKKTISFALDGFVYVLKENGEAIKLLGGRPVSDFKINSIPGSDNFIKQPVKIFTWAEIPNLYILEKNRILELDKNGKYLRMLAFDLKDVKDFWVNYKSKRIYILSENKIYEIKL